jgi:hypothetical protein
MDSSELLYGKIEFMKKFVWPFLQQKDFHYVKSWETKSSNVEPRPQGLHHSVLRNQDTLSRIRIQENDPEAQIRILTIYNLDPDSA